MLRSARCFARIYRSGGGPGSEEEAGLLASVPAEGFTEVEWNEAKVCTQLACHL